MTCDHLHRFFQNRFALLSGLVMIYATCSAAQQHRIPHELLRRRKKLEISRAARPWNFWLLLESGRDFSGTNLACRGLDLSAEDCARPAADDSDKAARSPRDSGAKRSCARPESTTSLITPAIHHGSEKFFVPVDHRERDRNSGDRKPLEVKGFRSRISSWNGLRRWEERISWNDALHGFVLARISSGFAGLAGHPAAAQPQLEYETNYGGSTQVR